MVVAAVLWTSVVSVTPSSSAAEPTGTAAPSANDPRLDADLAGVVVDSPELRAASARYRVTAEDLRRAQDRAATDERGLAEVASADRRLVATLDEARRRRDTSAVRLRTLRDLLQRIAVGEYVRGGVAAPAGITFDIQAGTDRRAERALVRSVRQSQLAEARALGRILDQTAAVIGQSEAELDDVRARTAALTADRGEAVGEGLQAAARLPAEGRAVADARLTSAVPGQDFTLVALDAYYKASRTMAREQPRCGIRWTLVAAIARTESGHGTFGRAHLDADGNESDPILGIALDGSAGTAAMGDTDGGAIDGDPSADRAVGPLQFIPGTWRRWGRDANGDGRVDPQNIADAALAAAAYLCHFGPGLDGDDGIRNSVLHYNNSQVYVDIVIDRAHGYDTFVWPRP